MATETQQAPLTHDAEPIVRDKLFIGGEWVDPLGDGTLEVTDSTTEQVMGRVPEGTPADVDRAVAAARSAFEVWSQVPAFDRAQACLGIGMKLAERGEEIAALVSREVGMPIELSAQIQAGLPTMSFMAQPELVEQTAWEEQVGNSLIVREPVGVVGCITPWNYPLHQLAAKVAPALAAGCTVVAKPSEITPLNAFVLAEIIDSLGLPPGIFNLVPGVGPVVGEAIAAHPGVDMVSFTGSTPAGRPAAAPAAAGPKRRSLELGGKSASILLDDLSGQPLADAIVGSLTGCLINSGQTCSALPRLLVPSAVLDEVVGNLEVFAQFAAMGDPLDPATQQGPLVSKIQQERVRGYITAALADGATLVAGGPEQPEHLPKGFFVKPTVLVAKPGSIIEQEEVFGPVLTVVPYAGGDEAAIRIANGTPYGLSGAVWAADRDRALHVARRLRTGQVGVNGGAFNPTAPFGGFGQSGYGRELGPLGIEEFTAITSIQL